MTELRSSQIVVDMIESQAELPPFRSWNPADPRPGRSGPPPFKFTLFDQIDPTPRKDWLVRRALGAAEFSIVYGDPGCGKSVLATDLAFHVATGSDWFSRRVKCGSVMYVAAERAKLTERRLSALRAKHELAEPRLALLDGRFDLFGKDEDAHRLAATAEAVKAATGEPVILIIVDTVARVIPGADENASRDMGRFIDNIDLLRRETGAHVMAIHHAGKDETKRMRGSTALLGAADTTIVVKKSEDGLRTATIDKSNDDGEGECFAFTLEGVELFTDPDTQETTTAPVVVPSDKPSPRPKSPRDSLSPAERTVFDCLLAALDDNGIPTPPQAGVPPAITRVVDEQHWRTLVYRRTKHSDEDDSAARKRFNRAKEKLIACSRIGKSGGWVWPAI